MRTIFSAASSRYNAKYPVPPQEITSSRISTSTRLPTSGCMWSTSTALLIFCSASAACSGEVSRRKSTMRSRSANASSEKTTSATTPVSGEPCDVRRRAPRGKYKHRQHGIRSPRAAYVHPLHARPREISRIAPRLPLVLRASAPYTRAHFRQHALQGDRYGLSDLSEA